MTLLSIYFYIKISLIFSFWVYIIQSASLFNEQRNKVKFFIAKSMAKSKRLWFLQSLNYWLLCPFCLSFWLSIPVALFFVNVWTPMIIPIMVNIINKLAFVYEKNN